MPKVEYNKRMDPIRRNLPVAILLAAPIFVLGGCSAMLIGEGQGSTASSTQVSEREAAANSTDQALSRAVSSKLSTDEQIGKFGISVTSSSGRVRLSGTVDSFEARDKAVSIASDVAGVTGIDNQIRVNTRMQ